MLRMMNVIKMKSKIKKTEHDKLSQAEQHRYEKIVTIHRLLSEGFAPVEIKEMLQTTYFRIQRYATGDPYKLCSFKSCEKEPEANH